MRHRGHRGHDAETSEELRSRRPVPASAEPGEETWDDVPYPTTTKYNA